jgi:hypothetical protein
MFTDGDGDSRNGRQGEAPLEVSADGVVTLIARGSERWMEIGRLEVRIGLEEVLEGTTVVEAMDLVAVMVLEEAKEVAEEVIDLDDCLVGEGRQEDLDGRRVGSHGGVRRRSAAGRRTARLGHLGLGKDVEVKLLVELR